MAEQSVRGRFVWHDLITPDRQAAAAFYASALDWQTSPWEQDPSYLLFSGPNGPIGGAIEERQGTPHWLPFIGTDDLDAVVRETERRGGTVRTPPAELPNAGRYAVLTDPQGAAFGVHWSATHQAPAAAPGVGEFSWHELATTDHGAALEFYQGLFGWEVVHEHDMGPMGTYFVFGRDGTQWGGIFDKGDAGAPGAAYWLGYVSVSDVDAAIERAKTARASLLAGPMDVPGGDRIAQLMDPHGAFFAVHARAADVPAAGAKPSAAEAPLAERKKAPAKRAKTDAVAERRVEKAATTASKKAAKGASKKAVSPKKAGKKAGKKVSKKTAKKTTKAATAKAKKKPAKKASNKAGKKGAKKKVAKRAKKGAAPARPKGKTKRKANVKAKAKAKQGSATSKRSAGKRSGKKAGKQTGRKAKKKARR